MSYCVHCGVRLAEAEKRCPLCATPVIDPCAKEAADSAPMFAEVLQAPPEKRLNRTFLANLVFGVLLVPFVITALVGVAAGVDLSWAFFVIGAELCLWAIVLLPLIWPGHRAYVYLVADVAAVTLLLAMVAEHSAGWSWFVGIAVPILAFACAVMLAIAWVVRRKALSALAKTGWVGVVLAFVPLGIDIIITAAQHTEEVAMWGMLAFVPMLALGLALVVLSESTRATEWIHRKLFL